MGDLKWVDALPPRKEGTTLIELQIYHLRDAHDAIGQRPKGAYVPVVLKPLTSANTCLCCCPCPYISIPAGFTAIVQSFGGSQLKGDQPDGGWSEGFHCLMPWNSVDRLVTKQYLVFDAPVRACKTKDNMQTNIDVMVTFKIDNASDFVYKWGGPEKFDDFLRACQEEVLRQMALERNVEDMYDLFGENTTQILKDLNAKFAAQGCGAVVESFTVKQVTISDEVANDLRAKTLYDPLQRQRNVEQDYKKLQLEQEEGKKKKEEEKANLRMEEAQEAEVTKQKAEKETQEVEAVTQQKIAEIEANRGEDAKKIRSAADLKVSQLQSEIMSMEQEVRSKTEADVNRILVETEAYCKKKVVEVDIENSAKNANGVKALGEAEGEASAAFAARRAFKAEMKRLDILEELVLKNNMTIATTQENTAGMNPDNMVVTEVAQQGLEALRAKLTEITATSLQKIQAQKPSQALMR